LDDRENLVERGLLEDFHCFDVTNVDSIIRELTLSFEGDDDYQTEGEKQTAALGKLIFLPAPRTWIECDTKGRKYNGGNATYLVDRGDGWANEYAIEAPHPEDTTHKWTTYQMGRIDLQNGRLHTWGEGEGHLLQGVCWLFSALALINSPRVISHVQHQPHKGLQRDLNKLRGGKFPMHAWTEIVLRVRNPEEPESHRDGYLTGARALHFVRKHIRIRLGRLEYVSAHWRGDPSIGIRQSRYRVVS